MKFLIIIKQVKTIFYKLHLLCKCQLYQLLSLKAGWQNNEKRSVFFERSAQNVIAAIDYWDKSFRQVNLSASKSF